MKKLVSTAILLLVFIHTHAQFWIGPKVGGTFTNNVYDDQTYKSRYNVSPDLNWHAGLSLDYDSEGRFVVHSELTYERVGNKVTNLSSEPKLEATSVYHFLSLPMMVRIIFAGQRSAVKFYGQAGPRMKFWLAGNGQTVADEFIENGFNGYGYKLRFKNVVDRDVSGLTDQDDAGIIHGAEFIIEKPNRVQYSLDIGAGMYMDLANGQRLSVDAKLSWGHSNMGFNVGGDGLDSPTFDEDIEYHHNMVTLSVAYLFYFDPVLARKGKTTDGTKKKKYKGRH